MELLDQLPIWVIYLVTVFSILLTAEIGFRIGIWLQHRSPNLDKIPMSGAVVGSVLGLMAFLLAFTIGIVINQHNNRKAMVVIEANAIGTAYLRADFLEETDRTHSRELLRKYVEQRLSGASDLAQFDSAMKRSEEIHNHLWEIVAENGRQGAESAIFALYVDSINEVIDVHSLRLTAVNLRLPTQLGRMLYITTILSFLLLGVSSSSDGKRNPFAIIIFAIIFVTVFILIVDLDRPQDGLLIVSQDALSDLLKMMETSSQ